MKTIQTPEEHAEALARVDALFSRGEAVSQEERDELEVLILLIETYESKTQPVSPPTPLEAIRFRMEQMGYRQKDLAELLGAASRASEVLAGKRGLTPGMMRQLRDAWGIPADSLLGPKEPDEAAGARAAAGPRRDPKDYPLKQMYDRNYFPGRSGNWLADRRDKGHLLDSFYRESGGAAPCWALNRQGGGAAAKLNPHALDAWRLHVTRRAAAEPALPAFDRAELDERFLRWLAGLSCLPEGPRLACGALREKGVAVVIEPRLDGTYLDGAALLVGGGRPIIGLTLRHDRLDNFWFTLFHEIGHVVLHLTPEQPVILDSEIDRLHTDRTEVEADRFALDGLIPPAAWEDLRHLRHAADIRAAAARLRLHPAIIAGRLRREANDYRKHTSLIGTGELAAIFPRDEEGGSR